MKFGYQPGARNNNTSVSTSANDISDRSRGTNNQSRRNLTLSMAARGGFTSRSQGRGDSDMVVDSTMHQLGGYAPDMSNDGNNEITPGDMDGVTV